MTKYILFLLVLWSHASSAQDTFWKYHDLFEADNEKPYDMHVINDTIYTWGSGRCGENTCLHFAVLDDSGEVILSKQYPGVIQGRRVALKDEHFYMAGRFVADSLSGYDGMRIFKYDLKGTLESTKKYDLTTAYGQDESEVDTYFSYGVAAMESNLVIYGGTIKNGSSQYAQGLLVWVDQTDLSLDTMVIMDPTTRIMDIWDAKMDQEGLLTVLYQDLRVGFQRSYRKYDAQGHLVYDWPGVPINQTAQAHMPLCITRENDVVFSGNSPEGENRSGMVMKINAAGDLLWSERLSSCWRPERRGFLDIMELRDGHILGAGLMANSYTGLKGGHLFKLDGDTGEMLWSRVYADWSDPREGADALFSTFFNVAELSDGRILVTGTQPRVEEVDGEYVTDSDLFVMALDADGCLEPGCGGTQHHIAGTPDYEDLFSPYSLLYYQDANSESGLSKEYAINLATTLDDIYYHLYSHANMDPRTCNDLDGYHMGDYFVEEQGRKVYVLLDQDTFLLYDFRLEVGDIFESDYMDQPLRVIESDTMRLSNKAKVRYWVLECTENPEHTITWIDKMGTYHGILWPRNFCSGDYGDRLLTCLYRFERFAHMNPDVEDCFMPTSTDDQAFLQLSAITAYPNPTTDLVTITAPSDLPITRTELMDTQGQTQLGHHDNTTQVIFDLSGYPSGLYFISIHTEKGSVVKKVVVE